MHGIEQIESANERAVRWAEAEKREKAREDRRANNPTLADKVFLARKYLRAKFAEFKARPTSDAKHELQAAILDYELAYCEWFVEKEGGPS